MVTSPQYLLCVCRNLCTSKGCCHLLLNLFYHLACLPPPFFLLLHLSCVTTSEQAEDVAALLEALARGDVSGVTIDPPRLTNTVQ